MSGLTLLQLKVSVDETWVDYVIIAIYFVFVLGIGAMLRNKMRTSEGRIGSSKVWSTG